ncbi:tetratricopeptide repeat protein [Streptomyces xinghaiensis]|uniref:tetratricopeptide repeat protein n=1 Tax=Streptomyces xinghaiensis TaxID=1038928 RepID=UPI00342FAB03
MTEQAVGTDGPAGVTAGGIIGRDRELKALRADIGRTGLDTLSGRKAARSRVLLVAGRPGSGRTALAEELARAVAADYPGGLYRVRLTEPDGRPVPPEDAARDLLGALGGSAPAGAAEDELTEAVRAALAGRRCLLLLDDAADPAQVHELIPDTPGCLVVAVSEGPLTGIPDVRPCTLGGLGTTAAVALLARYAGRTRVTVDPQAAQTLVEECGGRPAALLVAGGWLAGRPTASVADAVLGMRGLPSGADRAVRADPGAAAPVSGDGPSIRPLARAFRLAYGGLPQSAAVLLRLLALAPAGFADAQIASALAGCPLSVARSLLADLAARGMLRPAAEPPGLPGGPAYRLPGCLFPLVDAALREREKPAVIGTARARMLERLVRQLRSCRAAAERDEEPAARAWLEKLPRDLRFPSRAAAGMWLDARLPVLRTAVRLAVEEGEPATQARRLLSALARALIAHRGEEAAAPELYPLHQLALEAAERHRLVPEQAAAHVNLADLDAAAGRVRDAAARYRSALEAAREAGDRALAGRVMESLGAAYEELEDWQRAADWYGRALALRLSRGELAAEVRLYGRLGTVHGRAGDWEESLRDWRAAAAGCRRMRDDAGHARALGELAWTQERAGRPEESLRTGAEALAAARRAGDRRLAAGIQLRTADTLDRLGDPVAAGVQRAAAQRLLSETPGPA